MTSFQKDDHRFFISDSNGDGAWRRERGTSRSREAERWRGAVRDVERDEVWLRERVDVDPDDDARDVVSFARGLSDDDRDEARCCPVVDRDEDDRRVASLGRDDDP